jgi:hypothetical protein
MSPHATKADNPETDPAVYDAHHQVWSTTALPKGEGEWIERASQVAKILAEDVTVRDREQKIPTAEVSLLKSAGLLKVLGPTKFGGGGQPWNVAYKVIREVAKGDGYVLAVLFGVITDFAGPSGCSWDIICSGLGLPMWWAQPSKEIVLKRTSSRTTTLSEVSRRCHRQHFSLPSRAGAVNPRDSDLKITSDGDQIVFTVSQAG